MYLNPLIIALIFIVVLIGGGFLYYYNYKKGNQVSQVSPSTITFPELSSYLLKLKPGQQIHFNAEAYHGYIEKGVHNDEWEFVSYDINQNQSTLFPTYAQVATQLNRMVLNSKTFTVVCPNSKVLIVRSIGSTKDSAPKMIMGAKDD